MDSNNLQDKLMETIIMSGPPALMSSIGWIAYTIASPKQLPELRRMVGGAMLAGFVGWVGVIILTKSLGMDPQLAAVFSAMIGSSGERGYKYFRELAEAKRQADISKSISGELE